MSERSVDPPVAQVSSDDTLERDDRVIGKALRWSLVAVVVAVLAVGAVFIGRRLLVAQRLAADAAELKQAEMRAAESLVLVPKVVFVDVTQEAGIHFDLENGAYGDFLLPEAMCGGCAFFDYDNDGDADLFLANFGRWPWDTRPATEPARCALFRNDGNGRFADASAGSGLDVSCTGQGVAVGDYDNDGWVDVFISTVGPDLLFHNDGGTFTDVTAAARVAGAEDMWGSSSGFFDFDIDGDLDLFVGNYVEWSREYDIDQQCSLKGDIRTYCPPKHFKGTFPYLYRNDGGGRFTDVSAASGVQVRNRDTGVPVAKALGVVFSDVNADGYLDIIVANDKVQNFLLVNQRDGTFEETGERCGIAFNEAGRARSGMGIDAAWFRNDDLLGVTIANFSNEPSSLYVTDRSQDLFEDCAQASGLGPQSRPVVKFGTYFFDFDLDGRLDVLIANGHVHPAIAKVRPTEQYEQPPFLLFNCGTDSPSEFVLVPEDRCGADFCRPMVGRGAAFADIDADGDLDVLLTATSGSPRLLRNDLDLGRHWLRVKLVGRRCNRDAIGAVVELHAGGVVQRRDVSPTRSYISQVELPVTFGLGELGRADKLVIHWPDGSSQELADVAADQVLTIEQL